MGKTLLELRAEIDELHRSVAASTNCCIAWQDNGLLTFFSDRDGYPQHYFLSRDSREQEEYFNIRENFTSIARLIACIKEHETDEHTLYLLDAPVWFLVEESKIATYETRTLLTFEPASEDF